MAGIKVGNLDIQFGPGFEQAKANQLVQSLQQTIRAVNQLANQATTPSTPTTVTKHVLATQAGLGADHTTSGLAAGQVLVATDPISAHFAFLEFAQMAQTDPRTFASPSNGSVIAFVDGYWTASPTSFGLADPGSDAVILWDTTANAGAGGLTWALPGTGIKYSPGSISVDDTKLVHGHLLGLLADDHPQYALVGSVPSLSTANTFTALQTFEYGLVSGGDIDITGNLEQAGMEGVEDRIQNVDDQPNEGTWRVHVEPGQEMFAAVSDPDPGYPVGSDGENWLYVQRNGELVDTVGIEAASFTFNGFDLMVGDPIPGSPFFPVVVGGQRYQLLTTASAPAVPIYGPSTVAALPATAPSGARATVTDATAPAFLSAVTGSGSVVCPVFYNGAAWIVG
jgi:hypothetical protein